MYRWPENIILTSIFLIIQFPSLYRKRPSSLFLFEPHINFANRLIDRSQKTSHNQIQTSYAQPEEIETANEHTYTINLPTNNILKYDPNHDIRILNNHDGIIKPITRPLLAPRRLRRHHYHKDLQTTTRIDHRSHIPAWDGHSLESATHDRKFHRFTWNKTLLWFVINERCRSGGPFEGTARQIAPWHRHIN